MRYSLPLISLVAIGCASGRSAPPTAVGGGPPTRTRVVTNVGTYAIDSMDDDRVRIYIVSAPADQVWARLPAVYQALGIDAAVIDRAARAFGTRDQRLGARLAGKLPSTYLDCGKTPSGTPAADLYSVRLDLVTWLTDESGSTGVRTRVAARARPRSTSASIVGCRTTGELEQVIARMLGSPAGTG